MFFVGLGKIRSGLTPLSDKRFELNASALTFRYQTEVHFQKFLARRSENNPKIRF